MNEMKKNKKSWLIGLNIFAVVAILSVAIAQITLGITDIFAKEDGLSLTVKNSEDDIVTNAPFVMTIQDLRSESRISTPDNSSIPYTDLSQDMSGAINQVGTKVQRTWSIVLPKGINFDQEAEKVMLEQNGINSPSFQYDETSRTLTITAPTDITELDVLITAEVAGDYSLEVTDPNFPADKAQPLTFAVSENEASDSISPETDSVNIATLQSRVGLGTNVRTVNDWDAFVQALGDASVTGIKLGADITASNTTTATGVFRTTTAEVGTTDSTTNLKGFTPATYEYFYVDKAVSRNLVIDGDGKTFNFGNIAIGFTNNSSVINSYWNIMMQNINVESSNPYAPFYYPVLRYAGSGGMTGTNLSQAKLTYGNFASGSTSLYGSDYKHIKYVKNMGEFFLAYANRSVTDIQLAENIVFPAGNQSVNYQLPDINNSALNIFTGDSMTNNSGGTTFLYTRVRGAARTVNIDGGEFAIDFGTVTLCVQDATLYDNSGYNLRWHQTYTNMDFFHGNYWGPIEIQDLNDTYERQCWQRFENVTDYGAQFCQAESSVLYFAGDIHLEQQEYYRSVDKNGNPLRNDGANYSGSTDNSYFQVNNNNNQTIGVWTATFEDNSNVYLSSIGGVVVDLWSGGNLTVGENVNLTMERNGPNNAGEGVASVMSLRGGNFSVGKNSNVNMISHHSSQPAVMTLNSSSASIDIEEGAQVNLVTDSYSGSGNDPVLNPIYLGGGSINVNGSLTVTGTNMGTSNTHMIWSPNNVSFVIGKKGTLDIQSDSTNIDQRLIYMNGSGSTFQFTDAQRVNLQRTKTLATTATSTNNGLIYSGGNLEVSVQNVYQWTLGNTNGGADGNSGYTYAYEPMSSMNLRYAGSYNPTITSANSMTNATLASFNQNFTTRGQQRVLFTRIPDPSVSIDSVANDNPADPGSVTVKGYAIPNTYIRIWEEALNGTTSAKGEDEDNTKSSPVEDVNMPVETRKAFTTQADANGDWTYTITNGKHFTADNVIHAYGFANLKSEEPTQIVLDKTPPTGDGVTYTSYVGATVPDPSVFVTNVADTNPKAQTFTYEYVDQAAVEALLQTENTTGATVQIYVGDNAGNKAIIEGTLVVYQNAQGINADSPLELSYVDIREMSDAQLSAYILQESHPTAYKIVEGVKTDWTDVTQFSVTDLGGLTGLSGITPNTNYPVTITLPKSITGLDTDLTTTIQVTIINMNAVLTVEFVNEGGTVLSGYTLTAGEESSNNIVTNLYVGDTVDLTSSTYQKVQDQLAALQTAGYEITTRPADEAKLVITGTTQTVQYGVTGQLYLQSAPDEVDFGSITFNAKTQRVDNPTPDKDLVVTDTRADKTNGWTLYASLTSEMKNTVTGSIMSEALRYVKDGGQELTLNSGNQAVYTTTDGGSYDVTGDWGITATDPGLKLVADPNKTTVSSKGSYSGVITWTIMAGQP